MLHTFFSRIGDYMAQGGALMAPLAVLSFAMWGLIVRKVLFFRRISGRAGRREALAMVLGGGVPPNGRKDTPAALLAAEFTRRRSGDPELDRFILDETVVRLVSRMDDHLAAIGVLAGIAPLMGLLGTVLGMVATFDVIALFGTGNAKAMASGISEALITTQTGLLIAIPGLYMKTWLDRRGENAKRRIAAIGMYVRRHL